MSSAYGEWDPFFLRVFDRISVPDGFASYPEMGLSESFEHPRRCLLIKPGTCFLKRLAMETQHGLAAQRENSLRPSVIPTIASLKTPRSPPTHAGSARGPFGTLCKESAEKDNEVLNLTINFAPHDQFELGQSGQPLLRKSSPFA